MFHPVSFNHVRLVWPDGTVCLDDITATFSAGVTGIVGDNGAGKTSLLRLVSGELAATSGEVRVSGAVGVLPQHLTLATDATVADLLGVREVVDAVRAVASGDADPRHFDTIGDAWDVEARASEELAGVGLDLGLDRPVGTLSGGEATLVGIVGLRVRRTPIVCLDEPTNNLDAATRGRLYALIGRWSGTLLVVSHDLELLRRVDAIAEVRAGAVTGYTGPWDVYRTAVAGEQEAAQRAVRAAEQQLRVERRQKAEAQQRLARRAQAGRSAAARGVSKAARDFLANRSEKSVGRARGELDAKIDAARAAVEVAEARVREDAAVRIDLPDPGVGAGRRLLELRGADGTRHALVGPERVALVGPNGVGKTVLLERLLASRDGGLRTHRVGYLPQRIVLDDAQSALDHVRAVAPDAAPADVRNRLARFGLRGDSVLRPLGTLSGGERFRAAFAALLLRTPPAHLLILDEPTNNLDLTTVDVLVTALAEYRGGLLIVSHDADVLARIGVTRVLTLGVDASLTEGELA